MTNDINTDQNYIEDDHLYVYNEDEADIFEYDEDESLDNSALNYAQSSSVTSNVDDSGNAVDLSASPTEDEGVTHSSVFPLMLTVLSNPLEGWKTIRRKKVTEEDAQATCFYPLLALVALCQFAQLFYSHNKTVTEVIIGALCAFVGFFAGYFCIIILLKLLLPHEAKQDFDSQFGKVFVLVSLSTLCMFYSIIELLPMLWAVLIFMPLWTVYSMCRGVRFFNFPENRSIYSTGVLCVLTVGVPALIEWLLSEILPR